MRLNDKMVALSTISVSPHVTSVMGELAKKRPVTYFYHYEGHDPERVKFGWDNCCPLLKTEFVSDANRHELEDVPILIESMRDFDLIARRLKRGLHTIYMSERWLKPPIGIARVLSPQYLSMVRRFLGFCQSKYFHYFAQGVPAVEDMLRLLRIVRGDVRGVWSPYEYTIEKQPCGRVMPLVKDQEVLGLCQVMRLWGYFVAPGQKGKESLRMGDGNRTRQVLWVGRMVDWKRVDTLIRAVQKVAQSKGEEFLNLTLVGEGPEEMRLRKLAKHAPYIQFKPFLLGNKVRELMRAFDIYVLPSDGGEGWGAALSEALEEGMCVYGTYEAGSSSSILPKTHLFKAGDDEALAQLLKGPLEYGNIQEWSANEAAMMLDQFMNNLGANIL